MYTNSRKNRRVIVEKPWYILEADGVGLFDRYLAYDIFVVVVFSDESSTFAT